MSVFKPAFDAIGTGAGVAWPLFGILSSALSLGIGGVAMVSLGSICCGLFLIVGIPVFYLSYKKNKLEEMRLNKKLNTHLLNFMERLYRCYIEEATQLDFSSYLRQIDCEGAGEKMTIQALFLEFIKNNQNDFFYNYHQYTAIEKKEEAEEIIKAFINSADFKENSAVPSMRELLEGAFLNFVGVFGAVAGCSAGVMGVFAGLGLISGLSAIPFLGVAILCAAFVLGVCGAVLSVYSNSEKTQKIQLYKNFKHINDHFDAEINLDKQKEKVEPLPTKVSKPSELYQDWRSESLQSNKLKLDKISSLLFYQRVSREESEYSSVPHSFELS